VAANVQGAGGGMDLEWTRAGVGSTMNLVLNRWRRGPSARRRVGAGRARARLGWLPYESHFK